MASAAPSAKLPTVRAAQPDGCSGSPCSSPAHGSRSALGADSASSSSAGPARCSCSRCSSRQWGPSGASARRSPSPPPVRSSSWRGFSAARRGRGRQCDRSLLPRLAAGMPVLFRMGAMFHPESLFAALALAAVLVAVRAARREWPLQHAVALGLLLGLGALTRQTTGIVVVSLAVAVAVAARRRALVFGAVVAGVLLLVAGPWWLHQYDRYGNPIQSNLEREGYLLTEGQPRSFYVSVPVRDLVVHPFRPAFENELLPMIHADVWGDWFGGQHDYWQDPGRAERFFVSTQSVLGLPASVLAVGALFAFGVPALRRLLRGAPRRPDFIFATALLLVALSWIAFVVTLVRHPQAEGDPIKASYMLYLVPLFALVLVRAASTLWRRRRLWRIAVGAWVALYAASFVGYLLTSW